MVRLLKNYYSIFWIERYNKKAETFDTQKLPLFLKLLTGIGPVTSALPMRRSTD